MSKVEVGRCNGEGEGSKRRKLLTYTMSKVKAAGREYIA